jgi:hypothetical protein
MIPELKNMDYFLKITGSVNPNDMEILLREIRSLDSVSMAVKIDAKELPSRVYFFE